jgi:hypothetical protein
LSNTPKNLFHNAINRGVNQSISLGQPTSAEKALRGISGVEWSGLTSAEKALRGISGVEWNSLTSAEKALRGISGVEWNGLTSAEKALRGISGVEWNGLTSAEKALRGISGVEWNRLTSAEKALRGISGVEWNGLTSAEKALRGISGVGATIQRANLDFTNRLSKLPKHYTYIQSEKNNFQERHLSLVSEKTKEPAVPIDELQNAFGFLDIIKKVSEEEMVSFVGHLQRYPMLALEHKIGKLIRNTVNDLATKIHVSGSFYRCRIRNSDEIMPWTEMEMWEAPTGASSQGRFNTTGNGFLYVSRSQETAILEMKQPTGTLIDVMKLAFEAEIRIIDITNADLALFRYCMFKASNDSKVKKEYLVSISSHNAAKGKTSMQSSIKASLPQMSATTFFLII